MDEAKTFTVTVRSHMNPGRVCLEHNVRVAELAAKERHIDDVNGFTEVWGKQYTLEEAYNEAFGEAIDIYNSRQPQPCRRLKGVKDYMEHVAKDTRGRRRTKIENGKKVVDYSQKKGRRLAYERIVSVGNSTVKRTDANGITVCDSTGQEILPERVPYWVNHTACERYFEDFKRRYEGKFFIVSAVWHADEYYTNIKGNPQKGIEHLHIVFLPMAECKAKMPRQMSLNKCLQQCGYVAYHDSDGNLITELEQFNKAEQAYMESFAQEAYIEYVHDHPKYGKVHGTELDIRHPVAGKHDVENLSPKDFRKVMDLRNEIMRARLELKDMTKQVEDREKQLADRKHKVEIAEQRIIDTTKRRKELQDEIDGLDDIKAELESVRIRKADQEKQAKDAEARALAQKKKLEDIEEGIKEKTEAAAAATSEIERLTAELEKTQLQVEQAKMKIAEESESSIERLARIQLEYEQNLKTQHTDHDASRKAFLEQAELIGRNGSPVKGNVAYHDWLEEKKVYDIRQAKRDADNLRLMMEAKAKAIQKSADDHLDGISEQYTLYDPFNPDKE